MILIILFWEAAVALFAEVSGDMQDQQACEYARKTRKIKIWKEYLKAYPNGVCRFEARMLVADTLIIVGAASDSSGLVIAGVATGVIGLPMWITGAALLAKKRPVPDQKIELSNLSVSPTKGGMFTSVGFRF